MSVRVTVQMNPYFCTPRFSRPCRNPFLYLLSKATDWFLQRPQEMEKAEKFNIILFVFLKLTDYFKVVFFFNEAIF